MLLLPSVAMGHDSVGAHPDPGSSDSTDSHIEIRQGDREKASKEERARAFKKRASHRIYTMLDQRIVDKSQFGADIEKDLRAMADYYSSFPDVIKLFALIENKNWQLHFSKGEYYTDFSGTKLKIEKIKVFFDPKYGTQLKFYKKCEEKKPFCVCSPADTLLHELIHVSVIFGDIAQFFADGGVTSFTYPISHERRVIKHENALYKSMSKIDNKPRPIRSEHHGRPVLSSCVTCLE